MGFGLSTRTSGNVMILVLDSKIFCEIMCDEFLEYRVIKSKRKAKCQLVSDDDDDIVSLDQIISADCDDDNVMRSLFPNDTSGSLKVCEKHGSQIKCFCSIERKSGTT
jgi:hypothetical protein